MEKSQHVFFLYFVFSHQFPSSGNSSLSTETHVGFTALSVSPPPLCQYLPPHRWLFEQGPGSQHTRVGQVCPVQRSVQLFLILFSPNTWPFSRESQVIAESDRLCLEFGGDEETCVIGELFFGVGNTLGFECKRPVNSEPSPPGEILLILQDPTQYDSCALSCHSQRECTLPFCTFTWYSHSVSQLGLSHMTIQ